jgi:hypothetical protein
MPGSSGAHGVEHECSGFPGAKSEPSKTGNWILGLGYCTVSMNVPVSVVAPEVPVTVTA